MEKNPANLKLHLKLTGTSVCCAKKHSSDRLRCPFNSMQNEADSWYDSLCLSIQRSHELGCMPFETPLLTLGLEKELSRLFREKGLNGTSYVEIISVLWSLREHKNEKLVTVMANIMKVERNYPGEAQIQKSAMAASSARKPLVSFTKLQLSI